MALKPSLQRQTLPISGDPEIMVQPFPKLSDYVTQSDPRRAQFAKFDADMEQWRQGLQSQIAQAIKLTQVAGK